MEGSFWLKERSLNTTSLAVLGHILIRTKANAIISKAWPDKYKANDIWALSAPSSNDNKDLEIKKNIAANYAIDEPAFARITEILMTSYDDEVYVVKPPTAAKK